MSRSIKKGPYIDYKLEAKLIKMNEGKKKTVVKTWSRRSMISPDFVGITVAVHNGNKFIPVYVTENMVGHKFGEFAPTRTFRAHSGNKDKEAETSSSSSGSSGASGSSPGAAPAATPATPPPAK